MNASYDIPHHMLEKVLRGLETELAYWEESKGQLHGKSLATLEQNLQILTPWVPGFFLDGINTLNNGVFNPIKYPSDKDFIARVKKARFLLFSLLKKGRGCTSYIRTLSPAGILELGSQTASFKKYENNCWFDRVILKMKPNESDVRYSRHLAFTLSVLNPNYWPPLHQEIINKNRSPFDVLPVQGHQLAKALTAI